MVPSAGENDLAARAAVLADRLAAGGEKLVLVVAGAGLSLPHLLWRQPGCSRYLVACDIVYSLDEVARYTLRAEPDVSSATAEALARNCLRRHPEATLALAVTAAVSTQTRERKGDNKAELRLAPHRGRALRRSLHDELPKDLPRDACEAAIVAAALDLLTEYLGE